jgi:hypothetical protein
VSSSLHRHYTYFLMVDDPFLYPMMGAGLPWMYVGVRTAHGPVELDPYMGSSHYVDCARRMGIPFTKEILRTHLTRKRANRDEIDTLREFKYKGVEPNPMWDWLFNRAIPGDFAPGSRGEAVLRNLVYTVNNGPPSWYVPTEDHRLKVGKALGAHWALMHAFCHEQGIDSPGPGATNVDRAAFAAWKAQRNSPGQAGHQAQSAKFRVGQVADALVA